VQLARHLPEAPGDARQLLQPFVAAAASLFGPFSAQVITALAQLSSIGLVSTVIVCAPRILFGLSRDELFLPVFARVNAGGTPDAALLLTATIGDTTNSLLALVLIGLSLPGLWLGRRMGPADTRQRLSPRLSAVSPGLEAGSGAADRSAPPPWRGPAGAGSPPRRAR
jgi:hypothetical protein